MRLKWRESRGEGETMKYTTDQLRALSVAHLLDNDAVAPARSKCRRTRIKKSRAKRNRRKFYVCIGGKQRARDTGVRRSQMILTRT
jgi:hypothetical protein